MSTHIGYFLMIFQTGVEGQGRRDEQGEGEL